MENVTVLKSEIYSGDTLYRASLKRGRDGAIITVEQPFDKGKQFSPCSSWYLSTLMKNRSDGISIDFGQNWNIDQGMIGVIDEACRVLAKEYSL